MSLYIRRLQNLFLLLALIVGATGCTRSLEKSTESTVRLSVPQSISQTISAQAVTNSDLGHLMINITGPGINQPVFFVWDNKEGNNPTPPNFAIPNVPQGDIRLVQVLAIYKDTTLNKDIFYYGDITAPIKADVVPLSITVLQFQGVTGEGQIGGRYMTDSTNGPTGVVRMFYTPPGKPRMLVHFSEIYGGWFNLFALKGQPFEYVLDNGELLFGQPTHLDSTHINTLGADRMRVSLPDMYVEGGSGSREFRAAEEHVYGWFGPGATGKEICYDNNNGTIPQAYNAPSSGSPISWLPGTYVTSGSGVLPDSIENPINLCALNAKTRFVDYISLDQSTLAHHDGALAHRGPFIMQYNGTYKTSLLATFSSNLNLNWKYLPGVLSTGAYKGIDGADIFTRVIPGGANGDIRENYREGGGDGIDCMRLPLIQYPFSLVGYVSASDHTPVADGAAVTKAIPSATLGAGFGSAFSAGNAQVIVCPYQMTPNGKRYMREVAIHKVDGGGGSPPNPVSPAATPINSMQIDLTWSSGGGSTSDYRISYQVGSTAPADCASGTQISDASISGTSHSVTGLSSGTQYAFRICAIDAGGTNVSFGVVVNGTTY